MEWSGSHDTMITQVTSPIPKPLGYQPLATLGGVLKENLPRPETPGSPNVRNGA